MLVVAICIAGCDTAHKATVAKVAKAAISGSSFETGLPETDPKTVSLAIGYLNASEVSLGMLGIQSSKALSNQGVGEAIEGSLPPNTTRQWRAKLLREAEASLASK